MTASTGIITTIAGSGTGGDGGDGGDATSGELLYPYSVAVDSVGSVVYIADTYNNRIRKVTVGGTYSPRYAISISNYLFYFTLIRFPL